MLSASILPPQKPREDWPSFQNENAQLAQATLRELNSTGFPITENQCEQAIATWSWPGRYQLIQNSPPLLLDGAHNPHALNQLFDAIQRDKRFEAKPVHCVFSAINTKESTTMLNLVKQRSSVLVLCPTSVSRSLSYEDLTRLPHTEGLVRANPEIAVREAMVAAQRTGGMVVATGSLFLVADILALETGGMRDPAIAS